MKELEYENAQRLMKYEGIWSYMQNTAIYTPAEIIALVDIISEELKSLLETHVDFLQVYMDDRIIQMKR